MYIFPLFAIYSCSLLLVWSTHNFVYSACLEMVLLAEESKKNNIHLIKSFGVFLNRHIYKLYHQGWTGTKNCP